MRVVTQHPSRYVHPCPAWLRPQVLKAGQATAAPDVLVDFIDDRVQAIPFRDPDHLDGELAPDPADWGTS